MSEAFKSFVNFGVVDSKWHVVPPPCLRVCVRPFGCHIVCCVHNANYHCRRCCHCIFLFTSIPIKRWTHEWHLVFLPPLALSLYLIDFHHSGLTHCRHFVNKNIDSRVVVHPMFAYASFVRCWRWEMAMSTTNATLVLRFHHHICHMRQQMANG